MSLNKQQRQYIYNTITSYKDTYASVGTVANAFLCTLLAIGEKGIHIKSLEGIHISSDNTRGSSFSGTLNYIRTINKVLKQNLGPKAPRLTMDMLGNQRITWMLAEELAMDEAVEELNEVAKNETTETWQDNPNEFVDEDEDSDEYVEGGSWENKGGMYDDDEDEDGYVTGGSWENKGQ